MVNAPTHVLNSPNYEETDEFMDHNNRSDYLVRRGTQIGASLIYFSRPTASYAKKCYVFGGYCRFLVYKIAMSNLCYA